MQKFEEKMVIENGKAILGYYNEKDLFIEGKPPEQKNALPTERERSITLFKKIHELNTLKKEALKKLEKIDKAIESSLKEFNELNIKLGFEYIKKDNIS